MHIFRIIVILLFLFLGLPGMGQVRYDLDSLKQIFYSSPNRQTDLELLDALTYVSSEPDSIIKFSDLLIKAALAKSNRYFLMRGNHKRGVAWQRKGEYDKALEDLFKAAELADAMDSISSLGNTYIEIANVYSESDNFSLALPYYNQGIEKFRETGDSIQLAKTLFNFGDNLLENNKIDTALKVTEQAHILFQRLEKLALPRSYYVAYSGGNLGRIYAKKGEVQKAQNYLIKAIDTLEKFKDHAGIADFAAALADVSLENGDTLAAIGFAERSLKAAENFQLKEDLKNAHLQLSQLYQSVGDNEEALQHYKEFVRFKDDLENVEAYRNMANLRTDYELAKKQSEVDLLNEQRKNQQIVVVASIIAVALILLLSLGLYRRNKFISRTKKIIEREKNRSELLLLNILPQETAMELKENGRVAAKRFESVTILFTDFKNFTHYAENLAPEELVKSVDFYFSEFDRIVEKYGLEKIKTVGDAYMCASGVPFPSEDHAERVVAAACEMLDFVNDAKNLSSDVETRFDIRIGINTGPVVAGVVGSKKFAYDIWGDAVNIASRMETTSENGKINISENTYEVIKEKFHCTYRGEIPVKHKGMMKMYFVECVKDPSAWPQNKEARIGMK